MAEDPITPASIQAPNWRQWTEMLAGIAAAIAAVLSSFQVRNDLARALSFILAGTIVAVVSLRLYWKTQRERVERERKERMASWQTLQARSAFRGLYAYSEGDVLPGETRRREAHTIATQILNPDFTFGIIAGEVGCGKTSLLQCGVAHYVREAGATLLFVRSPRQLAPVIHLEAERGTHSFAEMLRGLSTQLQNLSEQPKPVVIVDQFEEFFIDSPTDHERLELGKICQRFLVRGGRMLVAVRHDYLLDMHDLSPAIPDPISTPGLYPLKNFRVAEATQIIQECASIDNVQINSSLANIIANDLAQSGNVRPPELQVVCTALAGDLTRERYEQLGGAKGIISDYIKTAVAVCPDPNVAKLVLRALCDFEASPPAKAAPQAIGDLTATLTARAGVSATSGQAEQILQILEKARITVSTRTPDGDFVHALVHDYLVSAVSLATTDISTRTEDANRLLSFYISAFNADPRIRIPLGKLLQIRSDASRSLLQSQSARTMIRLSQFAALRMISGLILFLVFVLVASGTRIRYQPKLLGHFVDDPNGEMLDTEHALQSLAKGKFIITGMQPEPYIFDSYSASYFGDSVATLWEASTGKRITKLIGRRLVADTTLIIAIEAKNTSLFMLDTRRMRTIALQNNERFLTYANGIAVTGQTYDDATDSASKPLEATEDTTVVSTDTIMLAPPFMRLRAININTRKSEGHLDSVPLSRILAIGEQGSAILFTAYETGTPSTLMIWDIRKHGRTQDLIRLETPSSDSWVMFGQGIFKVDEARGIAVGCSRLYPFGIYVWSTRDGTLLYEARSASPIDRFGCSIEFTAQGIVITGGEDGSSLRHLTAFLSSDGRSRRNIDLGDSTYVLTGADGRPVYLIGTVGKDSAMTWNLHSGQRQRIAGMTLPSLRAMALNIDDVHLLTVRGRRVVQLWDLSSGSKLHEGDTGQNVVDVAFTLDGQGFMLFLEGNRLTFKTLKGKTVLDATDAGGYLRYAYLNIECQRVNVWTDEGRVLQYTRGIAVPLLRFFPLRRCGERQISAPAQPVRANDRQT